MTDKKSFYRFLTLWSGELVSSIGSGMTAFALSIYVFKQTSLASSAGLVTLLAFLPTVLRKVKYPSLIIISQKVLQ